MPPAEPTTADSPEGSAPDEPNSNASAAPPIRGASRPSIAIHALSRVGHEHPSSTPELADWLEAQVRRAAELCGLTRAEVSIAIVDDDEMAELHEHYAGVPGTTDVLTFDLADAAADDDRPNPQSIEGDVVVCIDQAQRQAEARGHETRHELLLYAVHGLLHLVGEDDTTPDAFERMHAREDALLTEMGFGPLFNAER
ncbi:MAG: rRNA maturation RNase YbeY [Phycisphaeraceae bacterium]